MIHHSHTSNDAAAISPATSHHVMPSNPCLGAAIAAVTTSPHPFSRGQLSSHHTSIHAAVTKSPCDTPPSNPCLGDGIKAKTTSHNPIPRTFTFHCSNASSPISNTDVSTSDACHIEQTSLKDVTSATSKDLNTWSSVNSGQGSDDSTLNKTITKKFGNTGANGSITSLKEIIEVIWILPMDIHSD